MARRCADGSSSSSRPRGPVRPRPGSSRGGARSARRSASFPTPPRRSRCRPSCAPTACWRCSCTAACRRGRRSTWSRSTAARAIRTTPTSSSTPSPAAAPTAWRPLSRAASSRPASRWACRSPPITPAPPCEIGPFARRLRERPDLLARMRLLVHRHRLEPHEAAVPQALTGKPLGHPAAAGLGAHIQRYSLDRGARAAPYSYVFSTGGLPGDNVSAATATGLHPGAARPLRIDITSAQDFYTLLGRPALGALDARDRHDQLMQRLRRSVPAAAALEGRRRPGAQRALHRPVARRRVGRQRRRHRRRDGRIAVRRPRGPFVWREQSDRRAGHEPRRRPLLAHAPDRSRPATSACRTSACTRPRAAAATTRTRQRPRHRAQLRQPAAQPDSRSSTRPARPIRPSWISTDTLIILNTEFGRTPGRQDGGNGRNHHPYGYVTALHRRADPRRPGRHPWRHRPRRQRATESRYARARTASPRCSRSASGPSRPRRSRCRTCAAPPTRRTRPALSPSARSG